MLQQTNANTGPSKPESKGKTAIYAIASGKGGVGKTWFAITLSHALSNIGRKTLLFDGDLGLANVDIQLGLMPKHDLGTVVSGKLTLNQATLPFEEGGFDIIAGRSGSGNLANVSASRLHALDSRAHIVVSRGNLRRGVHVDRTTPSSEKGRCSQP